MDRIPAPPKGFVLEGAPASVPPPPAGFVIVGAREPQGFVAPEPPPGVIVHGGDGRSYIADKPEISVARDPAASEVDHAARMRALAARGNVDGPVQSFARAAQPFTQGQSMNWGDELISAIFGTVDQVRGGDFSAGYDYAQEFQRQELERRREEAPYASVAAELAGGLSTAAAAAPRVISGGASLAGNLTRSAAAGAALGGVAGAGAGDSVGERADEALISAIMGGGIGAVAPAVVRGVGSVVSRIRDGLSAREILGPAGTGRQAAEQVTRELARDGLTPADAQRRLREMGPDAMLLDLGENVSGGAEAVANQPGAGQRALRERIAERTAGAPQRIATAADAALGPQRNVAETVDDLVARRAAESGPAYARALSRHVPWNNRLQAFLDDPISRRGLRQGIEIQRLESLARNEPFNPRDFNITDFDAAGDPIITGTPNMRTLNVIKKGLDDMIESYRDPVTNRLALDERGRAIGEVQRAFLSELDRINPDYAEARRLWAGPTRVRDALGLGQDVFNRSVRPDQLRQRLAAMTDDEREAFRIGARDQLEEVMGTARRDAAAARGMFEQGWNREKLALVLGNEQGAEDFLSALGRETGFAVRGAQVTGGNATARRLQRSGEYDGRHSAARDLLDPATGLWGDIKRGGAKIVDMAIDRRQSANAERMRDQFGDTVSRRGQERDELIDAIMGYTDGQARRRQNAAPYEGAAARTLLGATPAAVNPQRRR